MDCAKAAELINQYIDGQLSESELSALREHLRTCAACGRILSQYETLAEEMHALSLPTPDIVTPALLKIKAAKAKKHARYKFYYAAAAVAACFVIGFAVLRFMGMGGSGRYESAALYETAEDAGVLEENEARENEKSGGLQAGVPPSGTFGEDFSPNTYSTDAEETEIFYLSPEDASLFLAELHALCGIPQEDFATSREDGYLVDISGIRSSAEAALLVIGVEADLGDVTQIQIFFI